MTTTPRPVPLPPARAGRAHWLTWKELEVEGRTVAYGEAGTGPTVCFLHGWALDHKVYKRALSRLAAAGLHVLAPALPGCNGSSALGGGDVTIRSYADWVAGFLEAVGEEAPVLVAGHSFGGGVAIALAHDHPARVRALVLINSIGGSAWSHHGSAVRSMAERPLWDWGLHFPSDLWPLGQARRVLPVILAEGVPNALRDPRSFLRSARLARSADLRPELEALRRRGLPVVVLWGTRDQIITRDSFEHLCALLGEPRAVTVAGSHSWLIADPDAFGEVMTNVVDVLTLAGTGPDTLAG